MEHENVYWLQIFIDRDDVDSFRELFMKSRLRKHTGILTIINDETPSEIQDIVLDEVLKIMNAQDVVDYLTTLTDTAQWNLLEKVLSRIPLGTPVPLFIMMRESAIHNKLNILSTVIDIANTLDIDDFGTDMDLNTCILRVLESLKHLKESRQEAIFMILSRFSLDIAPWEFISRIEDTLMDLADRRIINPISLNLEQVPAFSPLFIETIRNNYYL